MLDAIIVGGGLSGLSGGSLLVESGFHSSPHLHPFDLGAHWVGPGQEAILKLIKKFNIQTVPQNTKGLKISDHNGRIQTFTGDIPPLSIFGLLDLQFKGLNPVESMTKALSLDTPLSMPNAKELDGISVESWKQNYLFTQDAKDTIDLAVRALLGCEPSDISLLYFLFYVKSSKGIDYMTKVTNGAQDEVLKGGTQQISIKLAESLKNPVRLSSPVVSISQNETGVIVETWNPESQTREKFEAKTVILAIPPTQQRNIEFSPKLPLPHRNLCNRAFMGTYIKVYLTYETGFWRTKGFSGEVMVTGEKAEISFIYDTSSEEDSIWALAVFLAGKPAEEFQKKSLETRKESIIKLVATYFGQEAKTPTDYLEKDWSEEPFIAGAPVSLYPPGSFFRYGTEFRKPFGRVFFAGTETATNFVGYMAGAVEAGERAAKEVISFLSASN